MSEPKHGLIVKSSNNHYWVIIKEEEREDGYRAFCLVGYNNGNTSPLTQHLSHEYTKKELTEIIKNNKMKVIAYLPDLLMELDKEQSK